MLIVGMVYWQMAWECRLGWERVNHIQEQNSFLSLCLCGVTVCFQVPLISEGIAFHWLTAYTPQF